MAEPVTAVQLAAAAAQFAQLAWHIGVRIKGHIDAGASPNGSKDPADVRFLRELEAKIALLRVDLELIDKRAAEFDERQRGPLRQQLKAIGDKTQSTG